MGFSKMRFARGANAHLSNDETVAKMGHPNSLLGLNVGHPAHPDSDVDHPPTHL
jgi:hypothetical protein